MKFFKFQLITSIVTIAILLSGCSSKTPVATSSNNASPTPVNTSDPYFYTGPLENNLIEYLGKSDNIYFPIFPSFYEAGTLEVISDPDYKNLTVSITAVINPKGTKFGKSKKGVPFDPDAGSFQFRWVCARDAAQDFIGQVAYALKENGVWFYPKDGFKVNIKWITYTGKVTQDQFGNYDQSNLKEKLLAESMVNISTGNLIKIEWANLIPDYFALSDLEIPKKYPAAWDNCTESGPLPDYIDYLE
jgi:hypothetical protein